MRAMNSLATLRRFSTKQILSSNDATYEACGPIGCALAAPAMVIMRSAAKKNVFDCELPRALFNTVKLYEAGT
jgi:hypothetical protein